jgi:hypothetical protein
MERGSSMLPTRQKLEEKIEILNTKCEFYEILIERYKGMVTDLLSYRTSAPIIFKCPKCGFSPFLQEAKPE